MADNRHAPKVSRHTMVMRRARDDDARRVADREDDGVVVHANPDSISASLTARGAVTRIRPASGSQGSVSGRQVEVRESGRVSGRLSGRQAEAVRTAGGDTIIRYQSGDVVIKRGARRAQFRKQMLTVYAVGYLAIFGLFIYWMATGSATMTPEQYIDRSFARRQGEGIVDLERAAMEAMRGNRTPAEIRLAEALTFYDDNHDAITVDKGNRLTLLTASKLGQAIIRDMKREPSRREFQAPIRYYKESHLADVNWPRVMSAYNAIGFFLLLALFLWRPIMHYLGTQGKKTAVAIKNAREAEETATAYREKYRALAGEMEEADARMREETAARVGEEREAALEHARKQADAIAGGVGGMLAGEALRQAGSIGGAAAAAACEEARGILRERLGQAEHDAAIEELIARIAGTAPAAGQG